MDTLTTPAPTSTPSQATPASQVPPPGPRAMPPAPPKPTESRESRYNKYGGLPPKPTLNAPMPPKSDHPATVQPKAAEVKPNPTTEQPESVEPTTAPVVKPEDSLTTAPTKPGKTGADNWKTLRTRAETAEKRLKEYESQRVPEQERTTITTKMQQVEAENQRLANLIRYKDYQNSPEFNKTYHQPFVDKLEEVLRDVTQIPVTDPVTNETRYGTEQDIMELVGLDPLKRLQTAREKFGDLGDTVANYARDVKHVLDARNKALNDEFKNGETREQEMRTQTQVKAKALEDYVTRTYSDTFKAYQEHPETGVFLKPIAIPEGQTPTPEESEYNAAVLKGQADVESAWKSNPGSVKNQAELAALLKTRTKFGARAAAFPALYLTLKRTKAENVALKKSLAQYEATTPAGGGRIPNSVTPTGGKGDRDAQRIAMYNEISSRRR